MVQKSLQHIALTKQHKNKLQGRTNMKIDCNEEYAPQHNARRKNTKTYCKEQETRKHNAKYESLTQTVGKKNHENIWQGRINMKTQRKAQEI